jgi:hypothetical protein
MLEMLMIELPGCITRPHACAAQYEPLRLMSMTERNSSGVSRVAATAVPTAGVVDQHVDMVELGHRRIHHRLTMRRIGDVCGDCQCAPPGSLHEMRCAI